MLWWHALLKLILRNDLFKKKATFVRSGKLEMISTFQRDWHLRKVSVNKTFSHVQGRKKMSSRHSAYIPSSVKSPLMGHAYLPVRKTLRIVFHLLTAMILEKVRESIYGKEMGNSLLVFHLLKIIHLFQG